MSSGFSGEILLWGLIFIYPFVLTFANISKFFLKIKVSEFMLDIFGTFVGFFMTGIVFSLDSPDTLSNSRIIDFCIILGYMGLVLLGILKPEKTPHVISYIFTAFTLIGLIAGLLRYIKFSADFNILHLFCWLYLANIIVLVVRRIRNHLTKYKQSANRHKELIK